MSKQITQTQEDVYGICKQNVEKYFESLEKTIPQFCDSIADIQGELLKGYKNIIKSSISLQQELAKETGTNTELSESARNSIVDINKQLIKVNSTHDQMLQTTNDMINQNIRTWNDNANAFTDLSRNIMQYWLSTLVQKSD